MLTTHLNENYCDKTLKIERVYKGLFDPNMGNNKKYYVNTQRIDVGKRKTNFHLIWY